MQPVDDDPRMTITRLDPPSTSLTSRKLIGTVTAIGAIVGVVITLGLFQPGLLTPYVVFVSLMLIAGLGGFNAYRQAKIDEKGLPNGLP